MSVPPVQQTPASHHAVDDHHAHTVGGCGGHPHPHQVSPGGTASAVVVPVHQLHQSTQQQQEQYKSARSRAQDERVGKACWLCKYRKQKCDAGRPCTRCVKRGIECSEVAPELGSPLWRQMFRGRRHVMRSDAANAELIRQEEAAIPRRRQLARQKKRAGANREKRAGQGVGLETIAFAIEQHNRVLGQQRGPAVALRQQPGDGASSPDANSSGPPPHAQPQTPTQAPTQAPGAQARPSPPQQQPIQEQQQGQREKRQFMQQRKDLQQQQLQLQLQLQLQQLQLQLQVQHQQAFRAQARPGVQFNSRSLYGPAASPGGAEASGVGLPAGMARDAALLAAQQRQQQQQQQQWQMLQPRQQHVLPYFIPQQHPGAPWYPALLQPQSLPIPTGSTGSMRPASAPEAGEPQADNASDTPSSDDASGTPTSAMSPPATPRGDLLQRGRQEGFSLRGSAEQTSQDESGDSPPPVSRSGDAVKPREALDDAALLLSMGSGASQG